MIKLVVTNEKNLELYELEKVHVGENKFGYYLIFLPEVLNGYNLSDCEVKLIQIFEDNTSVAIDVDTTQETRPIKEFITLDATSQPQTVTLSVLITHNGDVIGKTNQKTFQVYQTKNATPIDPREELDEIIAEQRAEIAEQAETISTQGETITQQSEQITELNGEVTELTSENTRLENQHETDIRYIDYLIDNPPETRLQAKSVTPTTQMQTVEPDEGYGGLSTVTVGGVVPPILESKEITPSPQTQYYAPSEGKDGFSSVTVDGATVQNLGLNKDYYKQGEPFLNEVGTYNPLPFNSNGGIYVENWEDSNLPKNVVIKNFWKNSVVPFSLNNFFTTAEYGTIQSLEFENCDDIYEISWNSRFQNLLFFKTPRFARIYDRQTGLSSSVVEVVIGDKCPYLGGFGFDQCSSLETINLPSTLQIDNRPLTNIFRGCFSLKNVTIENGFNSQYLNLSTSTLYSVETIVSWLEALADRTGQTAYTLTIGTTNLNKLTAEQKAIATNKNWNLA